MGQDASRLFQMRDAPATVLNAFMIQEYGTEYLDWEPETVREELEDRFGTAKSIVGIDPFIVNEFCMDKIGAMSNVLKGEEYRMNCWMFEKVANAFNNEAVNFNWITPADANEVVWAILEMNLNDGAYDLDEKGQEVPTAIDFSYEVDKYIEFSLRNFGLVETPEILKPLWNKYVLKDVPVEIDLEHQDGLQKYIDIYCKLQIKKIIDYTNIYLNKQIPMELISRELFLSPKQALSIQTI